MSNNDERVIEGTFVVDEINAWVVC